MSQELLNAIDVLSQAIQALFTCLTFLVALIATIFGLRQLAEMSKARVLTAYMEINKLWQSDEDWRLFVYKLSDNPGNLSDQGQRTLERGLRKLDYIALLTESGYLPRNEFIERNYFPLLKIYLKVKPFLLYERNRKSPQWLKHIDGLCKESEEYRKQHHPEVQVVVYP